MTKDQIIYLFFGIVLILAVILDLGLLSKRSATLTVKKAIAQTIFWVSLALLFGCFVWLEKGPDPALEYISAYLMEWSLSIDNIFVFVLIFTFFRIGADHIPRALLLGILMAIIFRIIFITIGVVLVAKFHWILYVFGAFLVYTGFKFFFIKQEENFNPAKNPVYRFFNRFFPIIHDDIGGKFTVRRDGKKYYTNLFLVVILLATTDIVFALDSIPAVFAITQDKLVIYTSNIFAVLGLRALYFVLKGAVKKFIYLQQGIAIALIFIGLKMLAEIFHFQVPVYVSLMIIVICIAGSIGYSLQENSRKKNNI